jgi:hypothetical protein
MPEQSSQIAKSREFLNDFQQELDRFEQYELNLLQDDRKERERRMASRFASFDADTSLNK